MEIDISILANAIGDSVTAERFKEASHARKKAIDSILWNAEKHQWLDYWLTDPDSSEIHKWDASNQNKKLYASNFAPLWIEPFSSGSPARSFYHKNLCKICLILIWLIYPKLLSLSKKMFFLKKNPKFVKSLMCVSSSIIRLCNEVDFRVLIHYLLKNPIS